MLTEIPDNYAEMIVGSSKLEQNSYCVHFDFIDNGNDGRSRDRKHSHLLNCASNVEVGAHVLLFPV